MSMAGGLLQFGHTRTLRDVPVVAGEVGAGRRGLVHTLPRAMQPLSTATGFLQALQPLSTRPLKGSLPLSGCVSKNIKRLYQPCFKPEVITPFSLI